jgi:hypothetical protein
VDVIEVEGAGSRLRWDGRTVTIERISGIAKSVFGQRTTTVPVERISAVELVAPTLLKSGHIRFAVAGSQGSAQHTPVNRDEHAFLFSRRQAKEVGELAAAVRQALSQ